MGGIVDISDMRFTNHTVQKKTAFWEMIENDFHSILAKRMLRHELSRLLPAWVQVWVQLKKE